MILCDTKNLGILYFCHLGRTVTEMVFGILLKLRVKYNSECRQRTSTKLLQATFDGLQTKHRLQIFNQMLKSIKHGLQEKVQVSKDPEKVQKGRNNIFLNRCTSTLYGFYV